MSLAAILHIFLASALSGVAVVAALLAGVTTLWPLALAAATGFVAAVPLSIFLARKLDG